MQVEKHLIKLFTEWSGTKPEQITALPISASNRLYYRLKAGSVSAIGSYNQDERENKAFIYLARHFKNNNLPVPEIYGEDLANGVYLQQDLGDLTLYQQLVSSRKDDDFPNELLETYRKVIAFLPRFQIEGAKALDFKVCYPREAFDRQSMSWDLNYFKYYFLKLANISFDEQELEDDFSRFKDLLLSAGHEYFMYRDFQSRNIMLHDGEQWFIDFQGGRRGALQYDLASLLYDAKADLPVDIREQLLTYYISCLSQYKPVNEEKFRREFYSFVYIRIMQAMGAYGFRGFYEKKEHFLLSVPYALQNLEWLMENHPIEDQFPALSNVLKGIIASPQIRQAGRKKLSIEVNSFSYRKGLPVDSSGNGGGFVFDCRALNNPGRIDQYKSLTGMDEPVQKFLELQPEVKPFLDNVYGIIDYSVFTYLARNFEHLQINFGCTGGQHRSVYCAEQLAAHLKSNPNIVLTLNHLEQKFK
jgi:aminoglycoside/choline kinase family phosphotransferase